MGSLNTGFGVIATLVRGEEVTVRYSPVDLLTHTGRRGVKRSTQKGQDVSTGVAVRALVELCDREGWKVRTISTPVTVYRDLQGSREQRNPGGVAHLRTPEQKLLEGRTDLLEAAAARVTSEPSRSHRRSVRRAAA